MPIVIAGRALRVGVLLAAAALALAFPPSGAVPAGPAVAARSIAGPSLGPPSFLSRGAVPTVAWCGQGETADNRSPEVEVSSANQVHVVYAIPSDGADRFTSLVTPIVTDVAAIDQWWQREDPTRTPRFDLYAFPGCGTRFGMLDVTVERLPGTSASYQGEDGFRRLTGDVGTSAAGSVKTLAYYEGSHGGNVCGEAWTSPPSGGVFGVAIVYLSAPGGCGSDLGNGGRVALTAAHELTHTFGAVPSEAPNGCNGHACDSSADLMTAAASSIEGLFGKILDVNKDDYYGHSGAWWDVQDSDWLMHLPQFPITVTVVNQGGTGTVGSQPDTVACPGACSATWDTGTLVSLVAQPAANSRLLSWSGDCSGSDTCDVTMDGAKSVTATFGPGSFRVTVAVTGKGRITSAPRGLSCTGRCAGPFDAGTTVRLQAAPAKGYRFAGWKGDCSGVKACLLRVDRNRSARAVFNRR